MSKKGHRSFCLSILKEISDFSSKKQIKKRIFKRLERQFSFLEKRRQMASMIRSLLMNSLKLVCGPPRSSWTPG